MTWRRAPDVAYLLLLRVGKSDGAGRGGGGPCECFIFKTQMINIIVVIIVDEYVSVMGPKDTFDGSAQDKFRAKWTATKV